MPGNLEMCRNDLIFQIANIYLLCMVFSGEHTGCTFWALLHHDDETKESFRLAT